MPDPSVRVEGWSGGEREAGTFYSLREWMIWLLFSAIQHERDSKNMQLLLHGILVCLQDIGQWFHTQMYVLSVACPVHIHVCAVLYENAVAKMAEDAEGEGPAAAQRTEFFSSVDKGLHCFFFPFFIC